MSVYSNSYLKRGLTVFGGGGSVDSRDMGAERRFAVIDGGKRYGPAQDGPYKGLYWYEIRKVRSILHEANSTDNQLCNPLLWRGRFSKLSFNQFQYLLKCFPRSSKNAENIYTLLQGMCKDARDEIVREVPDAGLVVSEPEIAVDELLARPPTAEEMQVESSMAARFFLRAPRLWVKIFGRRMPRP